MALTKEQIEKLIDLIKQHINWISWRLLGTRYVTKEDIDKLKSSGILPMDVQINTTEYAFVLGKLESFLKEAEWKKLSWEELVRKVETGLSDIQMMQVDAASMSTQGVFRGLESDIQRGLFNDLAVATNKIVNEAVVKDIIKDKIKLGIEEQKTYLKVADDLEETLKEPQRNWARVATTELHNAYEQGVVAAIINKEDVYKYSEGEDSNVTIILDPKACEDCRRIYIDKKTGNPKIFKLSELLANAGTNYIRPWRKNARPVVPPLHPNCFCRLRYVPKGWGWNEKGKMTVLNPEEYRIKVKKSIEVLKKANDVSDESIASGGHSLLQSSKSTVDIPTKEEINQMQDVNQVTALIGKLNKLKNIYLNDADAYHHIQDLIYIALNQAYILDNGGLGGQEDVSQ